MKLELIKKRVTLFDEEGREIKSYRWALIEEKSGKYYKASTFFDMRLKEHFPEFTSCLKNAFLYGSRENAREDQRHVKGYFQKSLKIVKVYLTLEES